jgi:putative oxidoreductase
MVLSRRITMQAIANDASTSAHSRGATSINALLGRLVATGHETAPLVARIALGVVMFPHGAQKVLGWYGGHGFTATIGFMSGKLGIPVVFAVLAVAAEFLGSLGLLVGALSRVAAFGIAVVMLVAIFMVHMRMGFFMNWTGAQHGEGFEYHLLALGLAVVVMLRGSGAYSLDRMWATRRRAP